MTALLLVRHATTAATGRRLGGRTSAELDARGRGQADAVAERLADVPVAAVYASPLRRTWQTAEAIAGPQRRRVRELPGVIEVDYGAWTDRPLGQVRRTKRWPVIQTRPSRVTFPDGESIRAAQARAVEALEEVAAAHRREAVVVVSHADVLTAAVAFFLGQPLDLFQRLHVGPASVTWLQLDPDQPPMLLRLGDDGPLDAARFARRTSRSGGRSRRAGGAASQATDSDEDPARRRR